MAELRANLPDPEGVLLMSRCAKNRALYELAETEPPEAFAEHKPNKRGRRRKYGDRAKRPFEWLTERGGWRKSSLMVRGRGVPATWRVEGPYVIRKAAHRPVFLVVVKGIERVRAGRRRTRKPAFWLVSAIPDENNSACWRLPYPAEELLCWAWQRWRCLTAR